MSAKRTVKKGTLKGTPLEGIHTKKRKVSCEVCGKKTIIVGPRANKLCSQHKQEHKRAKQREWRQNAKEKKSKEANEVRRVRADGPATAEDAPSTVRRAQGRTSEEPGKRQEAEVAPEAEMDAPERKGRDNRGRVKRINAREALATIAALESQRGQGFRHGTIGNTGTGKTVTLRWLIGELARKSASRWTFIHDEKERDPQYPSNVVVDAFSKVPDELEDATVVIKGDVYADTSVPVEAVAEHAYRLSQMARVPVRVVLDELDAATTEGGKELVGTYTKKLFTKGRSLGVSVLWTTQHPQRVPGTVIDNASTIAVHRVGPRSLGYFDERLKFDDAFLQIVPQLDDFEWVLYEDGRPWNGIIYKTPPPTMERASLATSTQSSQSTKPSPSGCSNNSI